MTRAALYARVSTTGQAERGQSLAQQLASTRAYAEGRGWEIVGEHADTISGGKEWTSRPEAAALMAKIEGGEIDVVVMSKLDRFARSVVGGLTDLQRIKAAGCGIVFLNLGAEGVEGGSDTLDTTTPTGELQMTMLLAFAAFERRLIAERMLDGRRQKAEDMDEAGRVLPWLGGHLPFGYATDEATGYVVPDPVNADAVRRMFALRADRMSTTAIARKLTAEGYTSPRGGDLRADLVNACVQPSSRYYVGEGIERALADGEAPLTFAAPPLVTAEAFAAAIKGGAAVAKVEGGGEKRNPYALGSRIVHRHADGTVHGMVGITRPTASGPVRWYRCSAARDPKQTCDGLGVVNRQDMTSVQADYAEAAAVRFVWGTDWQQAARDRQTALGRLSEGFDMAEAEGRIEELQGRRDALYEAMSAGVEVAPIVAKIKAIEVEIVTVEDEIERVRQIEAEALATTVLPTLDEIMRAKVRTTESDEAADERRALEAHALPDVAARLVLEADADRYGRTPQLPGEVIEAAEDAAQTVELVTVIERNPEDARRPLVSFGHMFTEDLAPATAF